MPASLTNPFRSDILNSDERPLLLLIIVLAVKDSMDGPDPLQRPIEPSFPGGERPLLVVKLDKPNEVDFAKPITPVAAANLTGGYSKDPVDGINVEVAADKIVATGLHFNVQAFILVFRQIQG